MNHRRQRALYEITRLTQMRIKSFGAALFLLIFCQSLFLLVLYWNDRNAIEDYKSQIYDLQERLNQMVMNLSLSYILETCFSAEGCCFLQCIQSTYCSFNVGMQSRCYEPFFGAFSGIPPQIPGWPAAFSDFCFSGLQ